MSLYLGRNKVGVTYKDVNPNVIDNETLEELNDAVGYRVGDYSERNINQITEELNKNYFIKVDVDITSDYSSSWVRPQDWPDLDSLNLEMSGDDFIYMTYDNTHGRSAFAWHIEKVTNGTNISVTMGHINNGAYVVDETITGTSNNYVRWLTNQDDDYPVFRVTGDIYRCYTYNVSLNGVTQQYRRQPLLERIAWVPHLCQFSIDYRYYAWGQYSLQREKIANGTGTALTTAYYAWAHCYSLVDLDISEFYTPNITNLTAAFAYCLRLKELDLRHWDLKKVTSMDSTFINSRLLKKIDLSNCDTLVLTNLNAAFSGCTSLKEIKGIEKFKTNKVTALSSTFYNCRNLTNLNLTTWNTEKINTLYSTFYGCTNLIELNLSNWDISKVTTCYQSFTNCFNLKRIYMPEMTTGILTSFSYAFNGCYGLQKIDLSKFLVTSSCTSIYRAFYNCHSLKELDFTTWDISGLSTGDSFNSLFFNCYSLEKITGTSNWHINSNNLTGLFYQCHSLKEVDVNSWTINNCTNLSSAFYYCRSLKQLDLSGWDVSKCTTFGNMFYGCLSLTSVGDISNWNTSKVTSLVSMFRDCYSLKEFPSIQNWDLSNVTTMDSMCSGCISLEVINWDNINISKCTNIHQLFRYNYNMKKISTKNWTLNSNITYSSSYYHIYGECTSLVDLEGPIIPSTYTNIGLGGCNSLSYESIIRVFNALPQVSTTHTIHIPTAVTDILTTEEKAIATNKNWTIAT